MHKDLLEFCFSRCLQKNGGQKDNNKKGAKANRSSSVFSIQLQNVLSFHFLFFFVVCSIYTYRVFGSVAVYELKCANAALFMTISCW